MLGLAGFDSFLTFKLSEPLDLNRLFFVCLVRFVVLFKLSSERMTYRFS